MLSLDGESAMYLVWMEEPDGTESPLSIYTRMKRLSPQERELVEEVTGKIERFHAWSEEDVILGLRFLNCTKKQIRQKLKIGRGSLLSIPMDIIVSSCEIII